MKCPDCNREMTAIKHRCDYCGEEYTKALEAAFEDIESLEKEYEELKSFVAVCLEMLRKAKKELGDDYT